jgi:CheY-like chemotaxis protein
MEELHNSKQIESLGVMAGGIAHDFNNLLAGMFGFINLALLKKPPENIAVYLKKAMTAMERARKLTTQMLTFSKGGAPVKNVSNIVDVVEDAVKFALSGSDIKVSINSERKQHICNFDEHQIAQVLDNIVINAKQTDPPVTTLNITIKNIKIKKQNRYALDKGNYIQISIADNGPGIPAETAKHIFEPFFTTKEKGHGLGLSTSYSIIRKHGGNLSIEQKTDKGAIFNILLPLYADTPKDKADQKDSLITKGTGRILIMDDDESILNFLKEELQLLGYTVDTAKSGEGVLFHLKNKRAISDYSAMMFDLTVKGGMGGKELIKKIRKMDLKIPVFVVSGYSADNVMSNPSEFGFTDSLAKPFDSKTLHALLARNI